MGTNLLWVPNETVPPWSVELVASMPAWTLVQAFHAMARGFTELFAELGLTPTQFGVLGQLALEPGLIQSELARRVLVRPQSVGAVITYLADRDLVHREPGGGRGRARIVTITDAGQDLLAKAIPRLVRFNSPETLGLRPGEAETLNTLLHKVITTFQEPDHRAAAREAGDRR